MISATRFVRTPTRGHRHSHRRPPRSADSIIQLGGTIRGDCVTVTLVSAAGVLGSGVIDNSCQAPDAEGRDLAILAHGGYDLADLTITTSGGVRITNDTTLSAADFTPPGPAPAAGESKPAVSAQPLRPFRDVAIGKSDAGPERHAQPAGDEWRGRPALHHPMPRQPDPPRRQHHHPAWRPGRSRVRDEPGEARSARGGGGGNGGPLQAW
ncbi:MAG: hypothetical protein R2882_14320 [Gemmatimonadales bacterium]